MKPATSVERKGKRTFLKRLKVDDEEEIILFPEQKKKRFSYFFVQFNFPFFLS